MNKTDILLLFEYNDWADRRIFAAAKNLTQEQFIAPCLFPHGSLRATLVHILYSRIVWRCRISGLPLDGALIYPADFPTIAELVVRWEEEKATYQNFLQNLDDADLQSTLHYTTRKGEPYEAVVWHILLHVVNHGTQHRSEAAQMLTEASCSPGDIDFIIYLRQRQSAPLP